MIFFIEGLIKLKKENAIATSKWN